MGNKCQFCKTYYGGAKRVAGILQGNGCGCGRCSGVVESQKEAQIYAEYYKAEIRTLQVEIDSIKELQKELEANIQKLREIRYIK